MANAPKAAATGPDWGSVLKDMVSQASSAASQNWGSAKVYAETELKKLALQGEAVLADIQQGKYSYDEGQLLLDWQKSYAQRVIATAQGMNAIQAQAIVNAAMAVLTSALNAVIGAIKFT